MMANGLQRFYESFGGYLGELRENVRLQLERELHYDEEESDELIALTVDNLKGTMILFLCCIGVSCIILMIEIIARIIIFRLRERRFLRNFVYLP